MQFPFSSFRPGKAHLCRSDFSAVLSPPCCHLRSVLSTDSSVLKLGTARVSGLKGRTSRCSTSRQPRHNLLPAVPGRRVENTALACCSDAHSLITSDTQVINVFGSL